MPSSTHIVFVSPDVVLGGSRLDVPRAGTTSGWRWQLVARVVLSTDSPGAVGHEVLVDVDNIDFDISASDLRKQVTDAVVSVVNAASLGVTVDHNDLIFTLDVKRG